MEWARYDPLSGLLIVFLGKILHSHIASLHPWYIIKQVQHAGGGGGTGIPPRGKGAMD